MSNLTGNYKIGGGEVQGVDLLREREQERRARAHLLDVMREPSPQPIFCEPVKVELEDETSRRIKNTLGDFTQVLVNDPKNLIGISRSTSSSGHQMNGHPSNGYSSSGYAYNGYSMSSGGHPTASHQNSGYSSNSYVGNPHNSSTTGHYSRTPAVKKPPYVVNGAAVPKTSMPNYISPKGPDKRQGYNRPDKSGYYKPESPATAAPKTFHSSSSQPYHGQDNRPKDPVSWDKDQRRTNPSQPVAVNINCNAENNSNLMTSSNNVSNNTISSSVPSAWNGGTDTPAVQSAPFHLPSSSATPSVPAKNAANYGQTSTSYSSMPTTVKQDTQSNTPTKRNSFRPNSLKMQPEKKSAEAPLAVETILKFIFQEMTKAVPPAPLTAIQTPRTEETGFAFPTDPTNEESFMKLEEQVHLLTPLDDDPMPNDVHQSSPNSWWTSPDNKPETKYSQADCKVTDSSTYELSKNFKKVNGKSPESVPAPEIPPPASLESLSSEPSQKASDIDTKFVSSSLQDDLEMSDSDDEVVPEVKQNLDQYTVHLKPSPFATAENTAPANNLTSVNTNNTTTMESAESSNSSSSDSGESDSDDSSSESNDSDSSSEASDEEVSSKKWSLSNFVDESQRIHSPAFSVFNNDPATKESFRLHAERMKTFGNIAKIGGVNVNGATASSDVLLSTTLDGASFLVPNVPVNSKSDLLSPIPSPVHPTVGPRTPPSPTCPLKQNFSDANDESVNTHLENKSESNNVVADSNRSEELQVNCDASGEKVNAQTEKLKKQLRSGKSKSDDISSEHESSRMDFSVEEPNNSKELSDRPLESDKISTTAEKNASGSGSPSHPESSENYSIKTRQRVSAASSAKKVKPTGDNTTESNQKANVAIAKLKHPRACRKSNEKQNKKAPVITAAKPSSDESKKSLKPETKEAPSDKIKEPVKMPSKVKNIPKTSARSQNKISKSSPKPPEAKKPDAAKKKKKKFSMKNFVQSPENGNARLSNSLPAFTPSPERSPIPECPNIPEPVEEPPYSPVVQSRTPGRPSSKNPVKGKKVGKLRRSARCSERASINAQTDTSTTPQSNSENTKNSKTVGKAKRHVNLPISMEPPVELLSPIPQDPPLSSKLLDSAIPKKIMVCIPLAKILRLPVLQDQESVARQAVKNNLSAEDIRAQKKDGSEKQTAAVSSKQTPSKDLNEKIPSTQKTKNGTKNVPLKKKAKISKPSNETSSKPSVTSDVNKGSIKIKDKVFNEATENKVIKKRKNEGGEKPIAKKPKLSSRPADEKKQKEQSSVLKSDSISNQLENPSKTKGLERCDSTGSLSSLCSQQSQRSSKSAKEKKKDCPSSAPEAKRIKISMSPLLSTKDIKQEKEDKPPKNRSTLDARTQLDKNKLKLREKIPTVKDMTGHDQFWDDCLSSQFLDEQYKEDMKGKISMSSLDFINRELADWESFIPDIHKDIKGGKHNNQAPIMPMDYFFTEGKKVLCLAEKEKDPFHQAVKYFEAVVLFILTSQQREEYSKDTESVYNIYSVTLKLAVKLLQKIKKLQSCPGSTEFKLLILCLKSQSLLNVKHYNLKIKEVKEELDGASDFLKHQSSTSMGTNHTRVGNLPVVPPHSSIPSPASSVNSQSSNYNNNSVVVPQSVVDKIYRQHSVLINLHKGHDLWEQADMYMTRSNLREFFKEVADQSEPLTLHSSITELVKYIQKGISLVKKSLR